MTPCTTQATGTIELYFYDELEPDVRSVVATHLRSCGDCRLALEEMATIRAALSAGAGVEAPPNGDWTPFMERLAVACYLERPDTGSLAGASIREWSVRRAPVHGVPAREIARAPHREAMRYPLYLSMAALLALATSAVVYIARFAAGPAPAPSSVTNVAPPIGQAPAAAVPPSDRSADAAFAALSEQHFERSKLVVLGLANKDPQRAADWAYERGLATNLLSDTRLYRQAAEARGLRTLAGVMGDLEIVLLQTSLADAPDAEALGQIQRLIRKRDLVTKMEVTPAGVAGS